MNINDIKLFRDPLIQEFEEELIYKDSKIELWATKKADQKWTSKFNISDPSTYRLCAYFTLIIFRLEIDGSKTILDKYQTNTWNKLDLDFNVNTSGINENNTINKFLARFNSINRIAAYMLKAYARNRASRIPYYKDIIYKYEKDTPFIEAALTQIESLKPPRGNNGKVARQGK